MQTFNYDDTSQFVDVRVPSYFVSGRSPTENETRCVQLGLMRPTMIAMRTYFDETIRVKCQNDCANDSFFFVEEKIECNVLTYFFQFNILPSVTALTSDG